MFEVYEVKKGLSLGRCCRCGKPLPFETGDDYVCIECRYK